MMKTLQTKHGLIPLEVWKKETFSYFNNCNFTPRGFDIYTTNILRAYAKENAWNLDSNKIILVTVCYSLVFVFFPSFQVASRQEKSREIVAKELYLKKSVILNRVLQSHHPPKIIREWYLCWNFGEKKKLIIWVGCN